MESAHPILRRLLLGLLCLAVGAASSPGQQPPTTFPSKVELVTIDAVVLDAKGHPVSGLTRDDFVVTEDGHPQDISRFEAFVQEAPGEEQAALPPSVLASNEGTVGRTGRGFALVVDDVGLSPRDSTDARHAVSALLERSLQDGDEVSLGTTSGDVWWSARVPEGREDLLALVARVKGRDLDPSLPDSMSEYEAFAIHNHGTSSGGILERVVARWRRANLCLERDPACPAMVAGRATALDAARQTRTRLTLQCLRRAIEALLPIRGRKSVVLFSRGFVQDSGTELREVIAASREANVAVYFVDARGLVAQPGLPSAADAGGAPEPGEVGAMAFEASALDSGGAQTLADETGGFSVRNTNDLAAGAGRIAEESRVFYMLGFQPPGGKSEREWRKLHVEVKRPGLNVRARRGYTLRAEAGAPAVAASDKRGMPKPGSDGVVARVLDSAHDIADIPLRAMAYVFEPRPKDSAHVVMAVELDASRLAPPPQGKSRLAHLEVSMVATNRDSGRGFRHDDSVQVSVGGGEGDGRPSWRSLARQFELPVGITQVRVVVRDPANGAVGSVAQRFEIPPRGALHISTPILTDRVEPHEGTGLRAEPALAVHRVFAPQGALYCQFEVFGAALSGTGAPRVAAGIELRTRDGRVVRAAEPTPIVADAAGRVVRMVGMALDGMEAGGYELLLEIRDEVSGARLERHEPFTLAREGSRNPS